VRDTTHFVVTAWISAAWSDKWVWHMVSGS